uniref:ABC transporter domain-containing protein n=1 Tax=Parascaris equorum TaxID=6256 RepID=A0A914RJA4_PAREQ
MTTGGIKKNGIQREIRFESVSFDYPDRPHIFNDVSFRIPAGRVTAVVGPSGSGKSTLAGLLLRLYDPVMGRIMVDDIDLKELDPSHWRRQIGTEPVLFSTTIWNNIVYGAEKPELITNAQVQEAAAQSNALEFI